MRDPNKSRLSSWRQPVGTVYEPAEDSHLLATACIEYIDRDDRVIDVGTGSGYVAQQILTHTNACVVGIDVNPHACNRAYAAGIPAIRGDLTAAIADQSVDVIVCNPPYLPTDEAEARDDWMEVALSGGKTGRDVVEALFHDMDRVLDRNGRLYLLVSSLMDSNAVCTAAAQAGFDAVEVAKDASFPFETLSVFEFSRVGEWKEKP